MKDMRRCARRVIAAAGINGSRWQVATFRDTPSTTELLFARTVYACCIPHSRNAYSFLRVKLKLFRRKNPSSRWSCIIHYCLYLSLRYREGKVSFRGILVPDGIRFRTTNWKSCQANIQYDLQFMFKSLAMVG